ncbi:hypothetical protein H7F10_13910 [Acidithiobacillus sp. HP-6]|uniref:hypothetical protein n=1 Tax=unclassified Acidithiobacillus TaxID=2614800 RepID=UPI00187A8485|nr:MULTISPECIES: hypothetical protein [unclassified Acidithiobacillus]MBE7564001.1 hypothetical protein [Acidithiobacillus sp. HP-6]MBE7569242.1 hypothetical protein [Acidithiobacillus sp. HP-2]
MTDAESASPSRSPQPKKPGGKKSAAVAPRDCPEFQRCMEAAERDPTISADALLALFRDIGVYGTLLELTIVAENLQSILDLIDLAEFLNAPPVEMSQWPLLLDWILRQEPDVIPPSEYAKNPHKSPLTGVCTKSHPLYALLWWKTDLGQQDEWYLLQGHVLLAHLHLIARNKDRFYDFARVTSAPYDDVLGYTYRAGIFLREISARREGISAELLHPEHAPQELAESIYVAWQVYTRGEKTDGQEEQGDERERKQKSEFDEVFKKLTREPIHRSLRSHLQGFIYMLATAYDFHQPTGRLTQGRGKKESIVGYLPLMNLDQETVKPDFQDPQKPQRPLRKRAEAAGSFGSKPGDAVRYQKEYDIDVDENVGEAFVEEVPICSRKSGGGAANLLTTALQGRVRAEALQNQLFLWDYEQLTDTAIHGLRRAMAEAFPDALEKAPLKPSLRAQSLVILFILLGTGIGFEKCHQLKLVKSRGHIKGYHHFAFQSGEKRQWGTWYVKIEPPSRWYNQFAEAPKLCADIQDSILCLPDVTGCGEYLEQLLNHYSDKNLPKVRLFGEGRRNYQQDIQKYLRTVDPSGYLTLTRVENFLWYRCAGRGDIGETELVFPKKQRLGQVRRFYTTLTQKRLVARYVQVLQETYGSHSLLAGSVEVLPADNSGYLGSLFRPRIEIIRTGIKRLQDRLDQQVQSLPTLSNHAKNLSADWNAYYNDYTLYTWLYFAYATASRVICAPFPENPAEGTASGFIVHQDKSTRDQSHLRLLWLPPDLLQQLQRQWDLAMQQKKWSESSRVRDSASGSNFLMKGRAITGLCPNDLRPELISLFEVDMPVNSHRRFCRSYLLERGCPAEVVDAFMGHWYTGESPWSRYSSQSALAYVNLLKPYLESMLNSLGFRSQPLPTRVAKRQK